MRKLLAFVCGVVVAACVHQATTPAHSAKAKAAAPTGGLSGVVYGSSYGDDDYYGPHDDDDDGGAQDPDGSTSI
jgi:hypothetical protein